MRPGFVRWIGARPARRQPVAVLQRAELRDGLAGDHVAGRGSGRRQVTLIQAEHIAAIAAHLGLDDVNPEALRRNVVVSGVNLFALKDHHFRLGTAVLAMTGECHPCSRMEKALGPGGYNAVRRHGGITACVLEPGEVSLGDLVIRLPHLSRSDP